MATQAQKCHGCWFNAWAITHVFFDAVFVLAHLVVTAG
jgi:hypothetical protein